MPIGGLPRRITWMHSDDDYDFLTIENDGLVYSVRRVGGGLVEGADAAVGLDSVIGDEIAQFLLRQLKSRIGAGIGAGAGRAGRTVVAAVPGSEMHLCGVTANRFGFRVPHVSIEIRVRITV